MLKFKDLSLIFGWEKFLMLVKFVVNMHQERIKTEATNAIHL